MHVVCVRTGCLVGPKKKIIVFWALKSISFGVRARLGSNMEFYVKSKDSQLGGFF